MKKNKYNQVYDGKTCPSPNLILLIFHCYDRKDGYRESAAVVLAVEVYN